MTPTREVVLVHGLWMPGMAMTALAARLAERGFHPRIFSFSGQSKPMEAHVERLARVARGLGGAHYVGHSLGGLVVLETLGAHRDVAVGRVVLVGAPVRGCLAAQRFARHGFGRWMLGESERSLLAPRDAAWARPEDLGVIAGSFPLGLGATLGRLPGANDGVVRVEETEVRGMRERIVLPVGHSAMLVSARVAAQAASFLGDGKFLPG
jgi:pimeloyl-ACP methyl ester carboxylesterase